jgi:glyoxylase-like metal-dependent hydrolase (beta-lactamase superfamily II)
MKQIAPNVYVSTEYAYVNVGCVVGPTGVVALDAPTLPQEIITWRRQIAELTDQPIVYTALTDAHPHRLLCASLLEAPIVTSQDAYEQAANYSRGFWRNVLRRLKREHPEQEDALKTVRPGLPRLLFNDKLTLHKGGADVTIERTEGAAPGSSWVHFDDEGIIFLGDTLVVGRPPVMEECPDTKAWLNTLTRLRTSRFSDVTFVPGRGPLPERGSASQSTTEPLSEYIRLARRRVRSLHRKGQPRDDVVGFVDELLSVFPLSDEERSHFRRRARNGIKQVYDELEPDQDSE